MSASRRNAHNLTPDDMVILRQVCGGMSDEEIAAERGCKRESASKRVADLKTLILADDADGSRQGLIAYAKKHVLPHYPEEGST